MWEAGARCVSEWPALDTDLYGTASFLQLTDDALHPVVAADHHGDAVTQLRLRQKERKRKREATARREIGPGDVLPVQTHWQADISRCSSRHLFRLIDVTDGRHLAVFVRSEYLTHGARGHAVGDAVNVDLLPLVSVARGRLLLSLWRGLAAAEGDEEGNKLMN